MKKSDELFRLIKSLTKNEKRFFRLYSSHTQGNKNHLKLFDALEKQKEYDEDNIKQKFAHEKFVRHLPSVKAYLYSMLLRSLRSYHAEGSDMLKVLSFFMDSQLLFDRGLVTDIEKSARKALKLSEKLGLAWLTDASLRYLDFVYSNADATGKNYDEWKAQLEFEKRMQQSMLNITEIRLMDNEFIYLAKRYGAMNDAAGKTRLKKMLNHPLVSGKAPAYSFNETIQRVHFKAFIYYHLKEQKKEAEAYKELIALYEKGLADGRYMTYGNLIGSISNYINCCLDVNELRGLETYLNKYDSLKLTSPENTVTMASSIALRDRMRYYVHKGGHYTEEELINNIPTGAKKEHSFLINYYYALLIFRNKKREQAARVLNGLLSQGKNIPVDSMLKPASLLLLMCYYEMKEYSLLHSRAIATKRALTSKKELDDFSKTILNFFANTGNTANTKTLKKLSAELSVSPKNTRLQPEVQELEIREWLQSKIKK